MGLRNYSVSLTDRPLIVKRDVFAILVILGFPLISGVDIFTGLEHWPFGSYPMYSTVYPEQLSWLRLYGVTDGGEVPPPR